MRSKVAESACGAGWVYDRIQELAGKANGRAWGFGGVSGVEIVQLSTYEGQSRGFYDWHPVRIPWRFASRRPAPLLSCRSILSIRSDPRRLG